MTVCYCGVGFGSNLGLVVWSSWGWWFGRVGVGGLVELGLVVWSSWG